MNLNMEQELYSPALEVPKTVKCLIFFSQRENLRELLTGRISQNIWSSEVLQHSPALLCPCRCWSRNNSQGKTRTEAGACPKEKSSLQPLLGRLCSQPNYFRLKFKSP